MAESGEQHEPIWAGRPYQGVYWRPTDRLWAVCAIAAAILCVFLLGWHGGDSPTRWLVLLIVLPLVAYVVYFRLEHDAACRSRIRYVLTGRDLQIWVGDDTVPRRRVAVDQLGGLKPVWIDKRGIGCIELPATPPGLLAHALFNGNDIMVPAMNPGRRLELIDDPATLIALIEKLSTTAR